MICDGCLRADHDAPINPACEACSDSVQWIGELRSYDGWGVHADGTRWASTGRRLADGTWWQIHYIDPGHSC